MVASDTVTLYVKPPLGRQLQATIRADDVDYLEHFTATDREALICHLRNGRVIEIPLWALPASSQSIIATLKRPDVQIVSL
jgi:hypothetical protein